MEEVTRRLAFYDLRDWWLSHARVSELLDAGRSGLYGGTPFFPVAQQPEGGFPYVRYTVARQTGFPQWWMHTETVGLDIFAVDIEDSTELLNIFLGLTDQGSVSAQELQRWVSSQSGRDEDFEFHSLEWAGGGDIGTPSEEGATHNRIAMFNITYSPLSGHNIV